MAKNKTEKSYLLSKYGGGYISESQFLAETFFVMLSEKRREMLPLSFWNNNKYKKEFKHQLTKAAHLLREYPLSIILDTLKDDRCKKISSLGARWLLDPILEEKLRLYEANKRSMIEDIKVSSEQKPRKPFGKPSLLSQLD